jgi:hypothetical protein
MILSKKFMRMMMEDILLVDFKGMMISIIICFNSMMFKYFNLNLNEKKGK